MDAEVALWKFNQLFLDVEFLPESRKEEAKSVKEPKSSRKMHRYEQAVARRRQNRREEHARRRTRIKLSQENSKREKLSHNLDIFVNFGFASSMSNKEISKLVRQMGRVRGLQKKYFGLKISLCCPCERFLLEGQKVLSGFNSFDWTVIKDTSCLVDCDKDVVCLCPDADLPPLLSLSENEIYIIGGLVDETGLGSLTRVLGGRLNARLCRLPIPEFMKRKEKGTFNVMLSVNQVVETLARYVVTKNWAVSLASVLPKRIGFEVKGDDLLSHL